MSQSIGVCLFLLSCVSVCVQAQNCSVKCTSCASDSSNNRTMDFNTTECTQQCVERMDEGPMWKYCMEIGTWRRQKEEPTGKPRNSSLKWQYILAITLSVMFVVVSILAVMYSKWRPCSNPVVDSRWAYNKESIASDEENALDPV